MAAQIGKAVYLCCCIAAVTWGICSSVFLMLLSSDEPASGPRFVIIALFILVPAAVTWTAGLAVSYILTRR